jgi:hypothetical protein
MTIHLSDAEARLLEALAITEADRLDNSDDAYGEEYDMLLNLIARLRLSPIVPHNNAPDFDDQIPF